MLYVHDVIEIRTYWITIKPVYSTNQFYIYVRGDLTCMELSATYGKGTLQDQM